MEYIEKMCSFDSKLQIDSICSIEIRPRNRDMVVLNYEKDKIRWKKKLETQRELLRRKQNESAELDRKILDLADRKEEISRLQERIPTGSIEMKNSSDSEAYFEVK